MTDSRTVDGRWVLEERVGQGPLGAVHRGKQLGGHGFWRPVAVKELTPDLASHSGFVEALAKSSTAVAALPHAGVEEVLDVVRDGDGVLVVVGWCDGPSLRTWMEAHHERGAPAPYGQLLAIATKVLYSLSALHTRAVPIVHGGVAATAIRLDRTGQPWLVRAPVGGALESSGVDRDWARSVGLRRDTPEDRLSPASDVFAMGMLLYTALAGATDAAFLPDELKARALAGKPVDLGMIRADVPAVVLRTIERALLADPRERFDSATAMARSLELILRSMAENSDPPVLARSIEEHAPRKKRAAAPAAPPAPPRAAARPAAPPPPGSPPAPGAPPPPARRPPSGDLLGVRSETTDQIGLEELKALSLREDSSS